jgi:hypothetical protein
VAATGNEPVALSKAKPHRRVIPEWCQLTAQQLISHVANTIQCIAFAAAPLPMLAPVFTITLRKPVLR